MSQTLPSLGLPLIQPAQAQKHVTHNEALRILDAVTQLSVLDRTRTVPPPLSEDGDRHIVAPGATGAWQGQDHAIALSASGGWVFLTPRTGWIAYDAAGGEMVSFDGSAWGPLPGLGDPQNVGGVGVNTTSDSTNRLSVQADATLLSHDGAGHQLKVNKAAPAETGSLVFQTDWSGRAEMGLAGSDAFSVKVSPDGTAWWEALTVNPSAQEITLGPAGPVVASLTATGFTLDVPVSGNAVQQDADDATAGRLMLAEHGVLKSGILGTVAQSGGVPTGAVLEQGSNASGEYVRFADGTQICTRTVDVDINDTNAQDFGMPAAFASVTGGSATGAVLAQSGGTGSLHRRDALSRLPLWTTTTVWRVRMRDALAADSVTVALMATGRWY